MTANHHTQYFPGLADLAGDWMLERRIDDRASGQPGRFAGQARFTPVAGGLDYAEQGLLHLGGGRPLQAERRYLWRERDGGWEVFFADGRPFHRLCPTETEGFHACDPDSYAVRYDFSPWPLWHATWQVRGPRKDYTMVSRYRRG